MYDIFIVYPSIIECPSAGLSLASQPVDNARVSSVRSTQAGAFGYTIVAISICNKRKLFMVINLVFSTLALTSPWQ